MKKETKNKISFKQFRQSALKAYRLLYDDLISKGEAPQVEIENTARVITIRMLFLLAAGCRGMLDIPDLEKSPRPFMQNIHMWARDNPPHARRYFSSSDLYEPRKQPQLWRLHPSDNVFKEIINLLVEIDPYSWPANWPGSIYPHLLDTKRRKKDGVFYTPEPVVEYIVSQILGPICYRSPKTKKGVNDPEKILSIKVVDPAVGDGRFIIAALDYLAEAFAASNDEEINQDHRAQVARNCVYGVDRDPMVVDISRIAIWLHLGMSDLESSFLRNHIQPGNSLLGATIEDMESTLDNVSSETDQLALFKEKEEVVQAEPAPIRKIVRAGRMIERIKLLAHLWTSIDMDNEDALELYAKIRANVAMASEEKWSELEADPAMQRAMQIAGKHGFLHWEFRFPEVFFPRDNRPGGFTAVIGNPPYRKERGSGETAMPRSPSLRDWGEGKMDLIAYFIHRGLDLLEPEGRLGFITSSYWLKAEGARRLRQRLVDNENINGLIDLSDVPVFPGLTGRHCILMAGRGGRRPNPTKIISVKPDKEKAPDVLDALLRNDPEYFNTIEVSDQRNLLDENGDLHLGDRDIEALCRIMESSSIPLGEIVQSSQGIIDNPPELSQKIINNLSEIQPELVERMDYKPGEPVFLLPLDHPIISILTDSEKQLLRPFYRTSSIRAFSLLSEPDANLLYLTPSNCPDIDLFPNIKKHLERYRPVMDLRREVKQGRIRWWHLHWSRDAKIFSGDHLLLPQMVEAPMAARATAEAYAGISTHAITDPRGVSIRFVEAVLNSRAARFWLDGGQRAKRRGLRLDITLATLRKIPIPSISPLSGESVNAEVEDLLNIYERGFSSHAKK